MRKLMTAAAAVAATLMVPALAVSAEAAPSKASASIVGTSACAKTYPKGYWWTYPTENASGVRVASVAPAWPPNED